MPHLQLPLRHRWLRTLALMTKGRAVMLLNLGARARRHRQRFSRMLLLPLWLHPLLRPPPSIPLPVLCLRHRL